MQTNNPFACDGDSLEVVRPTHPPAEFETDTIFHEGVEQAEDLLPRPLPLLGDEEGREAFARAYRNPLLAVSGPLLYFAAQLRDCPRQDNVGGLIDHALDEIRRIQDGLMARGVSPEIIRVARYVLCATVDDLVLNTTWGSQSEWASRSLLSALYQETWGGERFFVILDHLLTDPTRNVDALEFMAICLAFGFGGKYRVMEQGAVELARIREQVYEAIRGVRGEVEEDLSPPFTGIRRPYRKPLLMVPGWVAAAAALCAIAFCYAMVWTTLRSDARSVIAQIEALVPPRPVLAVESPPPPPRPPVLTQLERIRARIANDAKPGQVEVVADARTITLRLSGEAMFAPSKAEVSGEYGALIRIIARVLDAEPGQITVTGHTDNSRPGPRGPSNLELSQQRAQMVAVILAEGVTEANRVRWVGIGDTGPLYPNTTAQGRAKNRRVEISLPRTEAAPP